MPPSAPPPLPQYAEPELQEAPRQFRVTSGTWVVFGVLFLGVFAAVAAWLHRHNLERKPLDFWGFDSHRVIRDCPTVRATLIKPDPLVLTPQTPGYEMWHDNLFMIVENRYLVEKRADVHDRPQFAQIEGKDAEFDPTLSLRRALRANSSYDWKAFPWAQEPEWRYALTFAKQETTFLGTKHELTRTFTFTLVFDVTCRWVTLQSVDKLTALEPDVQQRFKKFFLEVFPESDVPTAAPTPSPTATGTPTATSTPTAAPAGTGMTLGGGAILAPQTPATPAGAGSMTTPAGSAPSPPPLQLSPNPLLQPSSAAPPPVASPSGTIILPNLPTAVPSGTVILPTLPTTTSKTNP